MIDSHDTTEHCLTKYYCWTCSYSTQGSTRTMSGFHNHL